MYDGDIRVQILAKVPSSKRPAWIWDPPSIQTMGINVYILEVRRPEHKAGNCHTLPRFNDVFIQPSSI
jgi:hypothetical protein